MALDNIPIFCHNCRNIVLPACNATLITQATYRKTYITSPTQAEDARLQIRTLDVDIGTLDVTIDAMQRSQEGVQRSLTILSERRGTLEESRARYLALLSPMRSFPTELLSEIFLYTIAHNGVEWGPYYRSLLVTTISLGWVCSHWRDVAAITSSLWNHIVIHPTNGNSPWINPSLLREVWLPRSGNSPLTIHLYLKESPQKIRPEIPDELRSIIRTLRGVSSRWKKIALNSVTAGFKGLLVPRPQGVPVLEDLSITMGEPWLPGMLSNNYLSEAFVNAPALRTVKLTEVGFGAVELPWHQLTSLEITRGRLGQPSWAQCLFYLTHCRNLRNWVVTVNFNGESDFFGTPVRQDMLVTWNLTCAEDELDESEETFFSIFGAVTLPRLMTLTIESLFYHKPWDHTAFRSFLSRSACCIASFSLKAVTATEQDILDALAAMPTIEYLRLEEVLDGNGVLFFARLTYPEARAIAPEGAQRQPCTLPMLRELHLMADEHFDDDSLIAMLWSRLPHVLESFERLPDIRQRRTRLKIVGLASYHLTEAVKDELDAWHAAGLTVTEDPW